MSHSVFRLNPGFSAGILAAGVAIFGIAFAGAVAARAQSPNEEQRTVMTFNEPVEIPNMVLPAGTYVFQIMQPVSSQNIVQVFNQDGTHLIDTLLTVPDYRLKPTGHPVVNFEERAVGTPVAIRAWFFPGREYGHEFVYPHHRAAELARLNHTHVLSMGDGITADRFHNTTVYSVGPDGTSGTVADAVQTRP